VAIVAAAAEENEKVGLQEQFFLVGIEGMVPVFVSRDADTTEYFRVRRRVDLHSQVITRTSVRALRTLF
jgi:hypothetical protein